MIYISKGVVQAGSTEQLLHVARCGIDFELTGVRAGLWLDGRFGFAEEKDSLRIKELAHLNRIGIVEIAEEDTELGKYRALTQCVICPAETKLLRAAIKKEDADTLFWIQNAGLRLAIAELVFLTENRVRPEPELLHAENRQALTERIYTRETIFDNILETQMETAFSRDKTVKSVLRLLQKKRILLL